MDNFGRLSGQRLVAIFVMGFLLLNYPVLAIFNIDGMVFEIPILYLYIFVTWAVLICLTIIIIGWRK
jgi:hypothetical protein